jgi:hypothetical protein
MFFVRPAPFRIGPWLALGALACWGLAVFLLYFPRVAAFIVAGVLGLAGLALAALGAAAWRAESAARRAGPPPAPGPLREAEASWRERDTRPPA